MDDGWRSEIYITTLRIWRHVKLPNHQTPRLICTTRLTHKHQRSESFEPFPETPTMETSTWTSTVSAASIMIES